MCFDTAFLFTRCLPERQLTMYNPARFLYTEIDNTATPDLNVKKGEKRYILTNASCKEITGMNHFTT